MRKSQSSAVTRSLRTMKAVGPTCAFNNVRIFSRSIERIYEEAFKPVGLTASQAALLWTILSTEPIPLNDLAKVARADQTTVSRVVARAKRSGFLEVTRGTLDRRQKLVSLTPVGRSCLAQILPVWRRVQRLMASICDLDELQRTAVRVSRVAAGEGGRLGRPDEGESRLGRSQDPRHPRVVRA